VGEIERGDDERRRDRPRDGDGDARAWRERGNDDGLGRLPLRLGADGGDGARRDLGVIGARALRAAGHGQDGADERQSNRMPRAHGGHAPLEVLIVGALVNGSGLGAIPYPSL